MFSVFFFFFFFFFFLYFALYFVFFFFFFFFQAEDGIRDGTVTGVQTCALPISARSSERCGSSSSRCPTAASSRRQQTRKNIPAEMIQISTSPKGRVARRSEERRVGKECRSRWWPDH